MKLFGIIGFPLGHSFSQKHFTEKFERENLPDHAYRKFELPDIEMLPGLIDREPDLCGFNVTVPWKVKVIEYLDEIDPMAAEIGAVNTVRVTRREGKPWLKGFNTDAPARNGPGAGYRWCSKKRDAYAYGIEYHSCTCLAKACEGRLFI
jgi:shikimate dehydrogenase